jgi:hypothetical protein
MKGSRGRVNSNGNGNSNILAPLFLELFYKRTEAKPAPLKDGADIRELFLTYARLKKSDLQE